MRAIQRTKLPERLQDEGLSVLICEAGSLNDDYVAQLVEKSRQPHVQAYEGHEDVGTEQQPGRFRSVADYRKWAAGKERTLYMMVDAALQQDGVPDIGGVIWFGHRQHERAPGREVTFAIRNYAADASKGWGQYVGRGLGSPFMEAAHEHARLVYPGERVWLDLVDGNKPAEQLYRNNGYQELARFADDAHDGQSRVLMANDTVFQEI